MVKKTAPTKTPAKAAKKPAKKTAAPVEKEVAKPVEAPAPVQQTEPATIVPQISGEFLEFMTKLQTVNSMISSLLKLKTSDELTYFNLQKYMSPHFAKSGVPLVNNA